MLAYRRLDIIIAGAGSTPADNSRVLVCWELVTQHSQLDQTSFAVERSLSPQFSEDEYEVLETAIAGEPGVMVYEYVDITPSLVNFWRRYYYRIRASTPEGEFVSEAKTWETSPRPHELEIIQRHDFILQYLQGVPSFAFVERTADARHCICFDKTAGRPTRSDCTLCLGTGRQRPYFEPIPLFVDYNPDQELVNISNFGERQPKDKDCWFSAYPQMKPGDLIYEVLKGTIWRIANVNTIQPMGTTIQHVCRLTAIGRDEVEYSRLPQRIPDAMLQQIVQEWERTKEERMF